MIVPLMKMEYVIWYAPGADPAFSGSPQVEYRYDVSLVWEQAGGFVYLNFIDKRLRDGTSAYMVVIASGVTVQPTGCLMQYGANIIVSIYDRATYIAWPTFNPPGTPWSWHVEVAGKDVCPTPASFDFPDTLQGDLLIFSGHPNGPQGFDGYYTLAYDAISATDPAKVIIRLPVNADYTRSDNAAIVAAGLIPRWKVANIDAPLASGIIPPTDELPSSVQHFMHRGYFYRFVAVRQIADSNGSPVQLRSNPSADIFVRAQNYSPFFWREGTKNAFPDFVRVIQAAIPSQWFPDMDQGDHASWVPIPSIAAGHTLQTKYRNYFQDTNATAAGGTGLPLHWVAHWLGWNHVSDHDHGDATIYNGKPPYQCDVSAEELTGAPQTVFRWDSFGITDPNVIQIEVYRTAYEDIDPVKRPVTTPLFQPHVYGLVGTIDPNGTFTDTVKIPDFGQDPGEFEGYLRGQFSGDVEEKYGQSPAVVLGNVRVDYSLLTPSALVQAFLFQSPGQVQKVFLTHIETDGFPTRAYWYAYQDRNGFRSVATNIPVDTTSTTPGGSVGFTFPYGYDPNVVKLVLYVGIFGAVTPGVRTYYELATIASEPGTFVDEATNALPFATADARITVGDTPKFYEPGAIVYSTPDVPWDWPQQQAEKHNDSSPVRVLKVLMGELAVVTDTSFTLTLLRKEKPRSEEDTKALGAVTKHAMAKVEDALVILTQHGLYFLTPSRPEALPSHVTTDVLAFLTELVPGYFPLAALRRASIGYLDRRKELWLHIPSSVDLWPKLPGLDGQLTVLNPNAQPQRTFIFRFLESVRKMECYTFDISTDFEIKNVSQTLPAGFIGASAGADVVDIATYNPTQVLFASGSDGGLWCSYTARDGTLVTLDCDVPDLDYPGAAYGTIALGLDEPAGQKQIAKTEVLMQARGDVEIVTGIPKIASGGATSGGNSLLAGWDAIRGFIHDRARVWKFRKIVPDQPRAYHHPASDAALETKGSTVMVRIRTKPDSLGRHKVTINGLTVYLDPKHRHA